MENQTTQQFRPANTGTSNKPDDNPPVNPNNQSSSDDGVKNTQQPDPPVLSDEDRAQEAARQEAEVTEYYKKTYGDGASREYCEAAEEFDPTDPKLQAGEFWTYKDKDLEEHGNF